MRDVHARLASFRAERRTEAQAAALMEGRACLEPIDMDRPAAPTPGPAAAPSAGPTLAPAPPDDARRLARVFLDGAERDRLLLHWDATLERLGLPPDVTLVAFRHDEERACDVATLRSASFPPVPLGAVVPILNPPDAPPKMADAGSGRPAFPGSADWTIVRASTVDRPPPEGLTRYELRASGDGRYRQLRVLNAWTGIVCWTAEWEGTEAGWLARRAYDWMAGPDHPPADAPSDATPDPDAEAVGEALRDAFEATRPPAPAPDPGRLILRGAAPSPATLDDIP